MGNATEWRRVKGIALTSAIVAALISAGASPAWSTETPTDPPPAEETLAPSVEDTLRTQEISGTPVGEDATVPLEALPSPTPSPGETEEESADAETPLAEAQTPVAPATAPVAAINVVRPPLDPTEPEIQQEKMAVSQGLPNSASRFAVEGEANTYRIPRPTPGGT
ncbi:MAG TPA: hypothetical protein VN108_06380, partial [Marmoricola sp.]|nr:hypothetical protein [Marmoricola sp.]